jgi:hypothetical protein
MKTVFILIPLIILLLIIFLFWKKEHYNAIPTVWNWKQQNDDDMKKNTCIAKPGKYFC